MPRSLRVKAEYIPQVKRAVRNNLYVRQRDLAEELVIALSTVSNFLNGRPVDYLNFYEICQKLGQDLREIADYSVPESDRVSPEVEWVEPEEEEETTASTDWSRTIKRPLLEARCYDTINQPGSLLRIKAAKGMGKTLLLDKILDYAKQKKYKAVSLSLLLADGSVLQGLDQFLRWFCRYVSRQLHISYQSDFWNEGLGSSYNCTLYFEEYLLAQLQRPLVLALDDVDQIFAVKSVADEFLTMLRNWHDRAQTPGIWQNLRLILANSTEEYVIADLNGSPFNVGVEVELPDFTPEEVGRLAQQKGLTWQNSEVVSIMDKVGGHPHLVQKAIYALTQQDKTLEEILRTAATDAGIYGAHLRGHLLNLKQYPELRAAMAKVVAASSPVSIDSILAFKLHSLGLVQWEENQVKPSYRLYAEYFRDRLENSP
jgi:transcriptional regulator with XRE-family HTH domain